MGGGDVVDKIGEISWYRDVNEYRVYPHAYAWRLSYRAAGLVKLPISATRAPAISHSQS
jgi:hypothetical protein